MSFDRKPERVDHQIGHTSADANEPLSLALMRDTAMRSLQFTRTAAAETGSNALPLPVPGPDQVTIGQALEAAFLQLEALKARASSADLVDGDALDWSEELISPDVEVAARSLSRR